MAFLSEIRDIPPAPVGCTLRLGQVTLQASGGDVGAVAPGARHDARDFLGRGDDA